MILLIDVGNSRLKWTVAENGTLRALQAVEHEGQPGAALESLELPVCEQAWIANVTGAAHDGPLADAIDAQCGLRAQFARPRREWRGLRPAYAQPERLGVDRWLSMAALWIELEKPFCVVNAGTALTYDEVREGGRHAGGLIAPGLFTAWSAVKASTRFEMRPAPGAFGRGLGTDTDACVLQGALHACVGLIEHASREFLGPKILTGGDAATLHPHLSRGWLLRPNLVLEGLHALATNGNRA
ncbi:MAG TPA: type III pantothenate kinase [Verrucomicrobiae bacterium]|nr:type III pantothenate kinase [Verrucomicrobiae bacterium]